MTDAAGPQVELLLVAHGERRQAAANRGLLAHAAQIATQWPHTFVEAAVLNGEPSLEQALTVAAGRKLRCLLVYPFFMSDGYIVKQILHQHLRGRAPAKTSVMRPLGLDPCLPSLLLKESLRAAHAAGFVPSRTQLLVAGHGSRLAREPAASVAHIADSLRDRGIFAAVRPAYLEEQPLLRNELKNERPPIVVAGFFSGEGVHAWRDVPAAIREAGGEAAYTGPIGAHPEIVSLIMNAVVAELATLRRGGNGSALGHGCHEGTQLRPWEREPHG